MQDPDPWLIGQHITLPCPVDSDSVASIDPDHRERINYEVFYFSSSAARKRFQHDPLRYCGYLTDPVTQVRFRPDALSPHAEFDGRNFYFASDTSKRVFTAEPERYALRKGR